MMEGFRADSVKKREPASDVDTAVVDSLKALDPNRPIREADVSGSEFLRRKLIIEPYSAGRKTLL
jgi:hypothetical protein